MESPSRKLSPKNSAAEKALANVESWLGNDFSQWYAKYFDRIRNLRGATRLFRRISSAKDEEQLKDCLVEVRYAVVFLGLRFDVEFEPLGSKGPDLRIARGGQQVIVEITRFRKMYPGPLPVRQSDESPALLVYGNLPRDIRKAFEKIESKFRQIGDQQAIIAIWNDDEDLEEIEVAIATADLRKDGFHGVRCLPNGLLFVLYGSNWINDRQLYCFSLRNLDEPYKAWRVELESGTVADHVRYALSIPAINA